jgi:group I intron endonuclease
VRPGIAGLFLLFKDIMVKGGILVIIVSGIYKIEDVVTGNIYIGRADSENGIKKRWSNHLAKLRSGNHDYTELQEAWDIDKSRVKFEILQECSDEELEDAENYWIDYCKKVDGWTVINKRKEAKRKSKVKNKRNMRAAQQGINNGHCQTDIDIIIAIKSDIAMGMRNRDIAKKYGKSPSYISMVKIGERWADIV